ncbi:hypothetical protein PsYK624_155150 [Phanerochaete sordida]|uniref:Uncharacterized protein n=1 Tax=Phanerochaete sordida TaxID=48140 RepID=A0A9P3GPP4_9APHY|nr:hypothetical protein PsYK624_155150 [Phanerochaete sordida]
MLAHVLLPAGPHTERSEVTSGPEDSGNTWISAIAPWFLERGSLTRRLRSQTSLPGATDNVQHETAGVGGRAALRRRDLGAEASTASLAIGQLCMRGCFGRSLEVGGPAGCHEAPVSLDTSRSQAYPCDSNAET